MANLVSNRLVITDGNADTLANIMLKDLQGHGMAFFRPMPPYLLVNDYEKGETKIEKITISMRIMHTVNA